MCVYVIYVYVIKVYIRIFKAMLSVLRVINAE